MTRTAIGATPALSYTVIDSPVGPLLLAGTADALHAISFVAGRRTVTPDPSWIEDAAPLATTVRQLDEYFRGTRRTFDLTLHRSGTTFQQRVWDALREIPYGDTTSYGEIARRIGRPDAVRAVGAANGANPIPIVVPCHRVIGASGALTGFGGGLPLKARLLAFERGERRLIGD